MKSFGWFLKRCFVESNRLRTLVVVFAHISWWVASRSASANVREQIAHDRSLGGSLTTFLDMVAFEAIVTAGETVCLLDVVNCLGAASDFDVGFAKLWDSLLLFGIVVTLLRALLEYFDFNVGLVTLVVGGCDATVSVEAGDWYLVGRRMTRSGTDGRVSRFSDAVKQTFSSFKRSRNWICNWSRRDIANCTNIPNFNLLYNTENMIYKVSNNSLFSKLVEASIVGVCLSCYCQALFKKQVVCEV